MNNNDPITKADLQSLRDFIRQENRNRIDKLKNKVDNLTDAVIEGFDNTEQVLSDWEGKPINLLSKQTKSQLQEPETTKPA